METRSKSVSSEEARQLNRAVRARKGRGLESGEARAATVKDAASGAALLRSEQPAMSGRSTTSGQGAGVRALQRLAGNRAVCDLLSVGQAKLEVGPAGDRYEQEADDVARRVVGALQEAKRGEASPVDDDLQHDSTELVGRATKSGRATAPATAPEVGLEGGALELGTEAAIKSARSGGAALDNGVRRAMEGAFGADFSQVRVHSGSASSELNDRVQAKAFTIGNDIFFRDGAPDARTSHGQELLAHELTHTVQQGAARSLDTSPPRHREDE
jgi:hypothetical protein